MSAAIYSAAFLTSQFFQFALGDSPLGTGLRFLPWTATPLLVAPAAGALSDKIGARAALSWAWSPQGFPARRMGLAPGGWLRAMIVDW